MAPAYCWVHPRGQYFLSVKVPVPDEPGFDNFLLQWRESHTLDRADWWAWVRDKVR